MIPTIILKFFIARLGARWGPIAAYGLALALFAAAVAWGVSRIYAAGYQAGGDARDQARKAETEAIIEKRVAAAIAAYKRDQAIKDGGEAAIAKRRKELDDATANLPDQPLSERQRARACRELRSQGISGPGC